MDGAPRIGTGDLKDATVGESGQAVELEDVAALSTAGGDYASGKLNNGMGTERAGDASGADGLTDLDDAVFAIEIDEIDGELHGEGVDGFAGDDPEALAGAQAGAAEQAFAAARGGAGKFYVVANLGVAGGVADVKKPWRIRRLFGEQTPDPRGFRVSLGQGDPLLRARTASGRTGADRIAARFLKLFFRLHALDEAFHRDAGGNGLRRYGGLVRLMHRRA